MIVEIPKYPQPNPEPVPIRVDPIARSIAKPDAFAKPAVVGHPNTKVRVRLTNQRMPGRPKKRKRDIRDVRYF